MAAGPACSRPRTSGRVSRLAPPSQRKRQRGARFAPPGCRPHPQNPPSHPKHLREPVKSLLPQHRWPQAAPARKAGLCRHRRRHHRRQQCGGLGAPLRPRPPHRRSPGRAEGHRRPRRRLRAAVDHGLRLRRPARLAAPHPRGGCTGPRHSGKCTVGFRCGWKEAALAPAAPVGVAGVAGPGPLPRA